MAVYEYECTKCNKIFSLIKAMSKYNQKETCIFCGEPVKKKIATNISFILKGGGFYQTDYTNNKNKT